MAKWYHKVSLDWLKARQKVLSATDIKQLLPVTKTGRSRKVTHEDYYKVMASKVVELTEADCESTGAAARGHVLEPYAIRKFNECYGVENGEVLFHWDDVVLTNASGILGFSPDAINFKQEPDLEPLMVMGGVEYIGEVKCYSADRHLICGHTQKEELEERWQIAAAMAVYSSIDHAFLLFFNPSMEQQLFVIRYGRDELADEIETCLKIADGWADFVRDYKTVGPYALGNKCYKGDKDAEQKIILELSYKERLNPTTIKSVMLP